MPLKFRPISDKPHWAGSRWVIADDDQLADMVARVALGQSRYVRRVLRETGFESPDPKETELAGAIKLLTATDPDEPWHRDGWLFQVMSWIAANLQSPKGLIAPPHMIHAHKGFDGIHLRLDPKTHQVTSVIICEEKATDNARQMVRDRIWKEFEEMQQGERDNELLAEVTRLLESGKDLDVDKAIGEIIWKDHRAYRIAVTIDDSHDNVKGYGKLFKGYADVVDGDIGRRRAEVLYLKNLREWMDEIATKAIKKAKKLVAANV